MYTATISHPGLNRVRVIRGSSRWEIEQKAAAQRAAWDAIYARQRATDNRRDERERRQNAQEQAQEEAEERTEAARELLESIQNTLKTALRRRLVFSWEEKKNRTPFSEPEPTVSYFAYPPEPQPTDARFTPAVGLLDKIVTPLRDKKVAEAQSHYQAAEAEWQAACAGVQAENDRRYAAYAEAYEKWGQRKAEYEQRWMAFNAEVDLQRERYLSASAPEVMEYARAILNRSPYPEFFEKNFDLDYNAVRKVLVVDYDLPSFEELPKLKEIKYSRTKGEFSETLLSNAEASRLYADFLCQVVLRTTHELFSSDEAKVLATVAFNGFVSAVNPANGKIERCCVVALATTPGRFTDLNLSRVSAEECLTGLGGRFSSKLSECRTVVPFTANDPAFSSSGQPPAWVQDLRSRVEAAQGACSIRIADLQQLIGVTPGARAKLSDSRALIRLLGEGGFALEPNAGALVQAYRNEDAVAAFCPATAEEIAPSEIYQGAAAVFAMCVLVMTADGKLDPQQVDATRQYVQDAFQFSAADRQRSAALLAATLAGSGYILRALPKIAARLAPEQKEWAAEVATYIGLKGAALPVPARRMLERIFDAIGLPAETRKAVFDKYTGGAIEVTVAKADSQEGGEAIPAVAATPSFSLDLARIAAISKETKEVVEMLSDVMNEDEAKETVATPAIPPIPENPESNVPAALDPAYVGVFQEIVGKSEWSRADFDALASRYAVMPLAAIDVLNSWSDEALGDFLLEGDDPILVRIELIKNP